MIKKNGGIFGRNPTYNDVVVEGVLTLKEAQVFDNDITINGDLTVNGTETVINTVELNVDDKNITMGAVVAKVGLAATTNITAGQFTVRLSDTSGLIPGMTVTKTSGTGAFGVSPKIASVDSHTQITLTVAHATSGTIIFDTGGATDDTADGGGITLKGTTDKFIKWVKASVAWVFSDPIKAPYVTVDNLTASKPVGADANKKLVTISTIAIADGGTGKSTQQAAINALAGAVTSAQFLRGDGTDVKMSAIKASDVPTLNQNTTGTAAGLSATLATNKGGTGLTSFTSGGLLYATSNSALGTSSNLMFDGTSLGVFATPSAWGGAYKAISLNNPANSFFAWNGGSLAGIMCGGYIDSGYTHRYTWTGEVPTAFWNNDGGGGARSWAHAVAGTSGDPITWITDMSLDTSSNLNVKGNLVIGTSGKGIDFSATGQAGGMTSELLADYEEGTWTPTDASGAGLTFSNVDAYYTKIGRMVYAYCRITYPTTANANSAVIGGLPYNVQNTQGARQGSITYTSSTANRIFPIPNTAQAVFFIGTTAATNAQMSGTDNWLMIAYPTP